LLGPSDKKQKKPEQHTSRQAVKSTPIFYITTFGALGVFLPVTFGVYQGSFSKLPFLTNRQALVAGFQVRYPCYTPITGLTSC